MHDDNKSRSGADTNRGLGQRPRVVEVGDECAVCGRRHGDMSRPAPEHALGYEDELSDSSVEIGQTNRNTVRGLYLDDCHHALRKAIGVSSALCGTDGNDVAKLREQLEVVQSNIAPHANT